MIAQTSLMAYDELRRNPIRMGEQQSKVFECVKQGYLLNDKMISQRTGLPINVVTPRRNELVKAGLLIEKEILRCPITRKLTKFYEVYE